MYRYYSIDELQIMSRNSMKYLSDNWPVEKDAKQLRHEARLQAIEQCESIKFEAKA